VAVNIQGKELPDEMKKLTEGRGVDVAIDMVGRKETLEAALNSLAPAGILVIVGVWPGTTFEVSARVIQNERMLSGSRYATRQEIREALEIVQRGLVKPVLQYKFPLEQANQVHQLIDEMKLTGRAALIID